MCGSPHMKKEVDIHQDERKFGSESHKFAKVLNKYKWNSSKKKTEPSQSQAGKQIFKT